MSGTTRGAGVTIAIAIATTHNCYFTYEQQCSIIHSIHCIKLIYRTQGMASFCRQLFREIDEEKKMRWKWQVKNSRKPRWIARFAMSNLLVCVLFLRLFVLYYIPMHLTPVWLITKYVVMIHMTNNFRGKKKESI